MSRSEKVVIGIAVAHDQLRDVLRDCLHEPRPQRGPLHLIERLERQDELHRKAFRRMVGRYNALRDTLRPAIDLVSFVKSHEYPEEHSAEFVELTRLLDVLETRIRQATGMGALMSDTYDRNMHPKLGGGLLDLDSPDPADIDITHIAHSLAGSRRFAGTGRVTVAQHSVDVAQVVEKAVGLASTAELRMAALLHDAHEAYMGDITRSVARIIGYERVGDLKARLQGAIHLNFGLPWPISERDRAIIARADMFVGTAEAINEFPGERQLWLDQYHHAEGDKAPEPPPWTEITWGKAAMTAREATYYFLDHFFYLHEEMKSDD